MSSSSKRRLSVDDDVVVISTPQNQKRAASEVATASSASGVKKARQSPAKKALFSPSTPASAAAAAKGKALTVSPTPVKSTAATTSSSSSSTLSPSRSLSVRSSVLFGGEEEDQKALQVHIPVFIHRNVGYKAKGTKEAEEGLNAGQKKAFGTISSKCVIPPDFESSRRYGPLSGISYGQRVLGAFQSGFLEVKGKREFKICVSCGDEGHIKKECEK